MWACSLHVKNTLRAILIFAQKDIVSCKAVEYFHTPKEKIFRKANSGRTSSSLEGAIWQILCTSPTNKSINHSHASKESQDYNKQ